MFDNTLIRLLLLSEVHVAIFHEELLDEKRHHTNPIPRTAPSPTIEKDDRP
ncbi:hypothetical protein [Desulfocastanea catecholica]